MSELAFNYKGRRFLLPKEAMYWSVERLRDDQRGQLDVVRGSDGLPLILSITTSIDEFHAQNEDRPGRYKLTALDEAKMELEGVPAAYVTVPAERRPADFVEAGRKDAGADTRWPREGSAPAATVTTPFGTWPALPMPVAMSGAEYLLGEALRGQVQMFQMLTAALSDRNASNAHGTSQMMTAAAELLRAADGASMPHRRPLPEPVALPQVAPTSPSAAETRNGSRLVPTVEVVEDDETDEELEDDGASPIGPQNDLDSFMSKFGSAIAAVGPAIPHLVTLVRGYPPTAPETLRNANPENSASDAEEEGAEAPFCEVSPSIWSHIRLIHEELGEDGALFRSVYQSLDTRRRREILDQLGSMGVEDAADAVAAMIAPYKLRIARRSRATAPTHVEIVEDASTEEVPASTASDDAQFAASQPTVPDDTLAANRSEEHPNQENPIEEPNKHSPDVPELRPELEIPPPANDEARIALGSNTELAPAKRTRPSRGTAANRARSHSSPDSASRATPMGSAKDVEVPEARMQDIAKHLSIPEKLRVHALIGTLTSTERAEWIRRLADLAPVEAAAVVRAELARRSNR